MSQSWQFLGSSNLNVKVKTEVGLERKGLVSGQNSNSSETTLHLFEQEWGEKFSRVS